MVFYMFIFLSLVYDFYAPASCARQRLYYYVFTVCHRLSCCPDVQCQHGLVHSMGESIIHMQ